MNIAKKTEKMKKKALKNISLTLVVALSITACATKPPSKYSPGKSYLQQSKNSKTGESVPKPQNKNTQSNGFVDNVNLLTNSANKKQSGLTYLSSLKTETTKIKKIVDLTQQFSNTDLVQLTADGLPLTDYLNYVMGELLGVSYILGEQVKSDDKTVTLNIQQDISKRKLFTLSENILAERGYIIRFDDGIYYIHQADGAGAQGDIVYGYGKSIDNVPNTSSTIIQMVPFEFGVQTNLSLVLASIAKVKVTVDTNHNAFILHGKRQEILKAIDFISLMDQPGFKTRQIGLYKAVYISSFEIKNKIPELLAQEGISVSVSSQINKAVSIVSLDHSGTLVFFANNRNILERVGFWAKKIDQPPSGNQLNYFLYQPIFSRATDLGTSLQSLIGGNNGNLGNKASAVSQNTNNKLAVKKSSKGMSASNENMKLVIDERANALIFQTTGDKYRQLLPLIKRLDVMPKQVMLEVMIAEVKLTDVFKQGVEFALSNQGSALSGGFNLNSGSAGLSYILSGLKGKLTLKLLQTNSHVNVLSRPSLLVRDGVTANITVGDDIPTAGEIITDPVNGSKTSVIYRKTGVELSVTPTINAQGVVIMEIKQKISNQAKGSDTVAGSPIIFERSISTEVVAESGQTIILGGLISENRTINDTTVPFFSSIPLIGALFNSTDNTGDKTELVVLVTPRIIESNNEWQEIRKKLAENLSELILN